MTDDGERFLIEGRDLGYPTRFPSGSSMMAVFAVPALAAARLVASTPFTPAPFIAGRALVTLNCVHYVETDAGSYEEVALAVLVDDPTLPPVASGAVRRWRSLLNGSIGAHSWRLGVSSTLSRDCGLRMWGFPKVVGDVRFHRDGDRAEMRWGQDGALVLRYRSTTRGRRTVGPISPAVYSMHRGAPHVGRLTQRYRGVGYRFGGGQLDLGTHEFADELRSLGLPRRPILSIWNEHIDFEMGAPSPIAMKSWRTGR